MLFGRRVAGRWLFFSSLYEGGACLLLGCLRCVQESPKKSSEKVFRGGRKDETATHHIVFPRFERIETNLVLVKSCIATQGRSVLRPQQKTKPGKVHPRRRPLG